MTCKLLLSLLCWWKKKKKICKYFSIVNDMIWGEDIYIKRSWTRRVMYGLLHCHVHHSALSVHYSVRCEPPQSRLLYSTSKGEGDGGGLAMVWWCTRQGWVRTMTTLSGFHTLRGENNDNSEWWTWKWRRLYKLQPSLLNLPCDSLLRKNRNK